MSKKVDLWLDLSSPFSFLAKDPAYALEKDSSVTLRLRPFGARTSLGAYNLSDPEVTARGLRKIKYLYLRRPPLRRTSAASSCGDRKKIFDQTLSISPGCLPTRAAKGRALIDLAYPRFFKRELDYEDRAAVDAPADGSRRRCRGLRRLRAGEGPADSPRHQAGGRASRACSPCRPSSSTANCSGARTGSTSCAPSSRQRRLTAQPLSTKVRDPMKRLTTLRLIA